MPPLVELPKNVNAPLYFLPGPLSVTNDWSLIIEISVPKL